MAKPQQCPLSAIYFTWLTLAAGLGFFVLRADWAGTVVMAVGFPLFLWTYVRVFPRIARRLGYGDVSDRPAAPAPQARGAGRVVLYTALGCPFCPLVRDRLRRLSAQWGFALEEIDVTARPDLARAKEIRAVPSIEVGGRLHAGAATTRALAELILGGAAPAPRPAVAVPAGAA